MKFFANDEMGLKIARVSIIAFGEKLADDLIDENKFIHRFANRLFSSVIKDAREKEPEMAKSGDEGMVVIRDLQDKNASLFEVLPAYEDMAVKAFSTFVDLSPVTEEFLRSVAAWTYFVDMICDYADDYKDGAYNALKTEGLATFTEYFNVKYKEFLAYEKKVTDRVMSAIDASDDGSAAHRTLKKIITHSIDTVIPAAINGQDIKFHYIQNLIKNYTDMYKYNKMVKKLGVTKQ